MRLPLLLSLLWTICSTVLIRPWFWISIIKRKTIEGDDENTGFRNDNESDPSSAMIVQAILAVVTFIISTFVYFKVKTRYNFYGSIFPILFVLVFQWLTMKFLCLDKHCKGKTAILVIIGIICVFFSLEDATRKENRVESFDKEIPVVFFSKEQAEKGEDLPSREIIASLFNATDVLNPVYSNGKFIYIVNAGINGYGIVVINEDSAESAKFIACDTGYGVSIKLRSQYPNDRIEERSVVITDDDVPFAKYVILDKTGLFGELVIGKYILQNMLTGEITEYTVEELPEFAR